MNLKTKNENWFSNIKLEEKSYNKTIILGKFVTLHLGHQFMLEKLSEDEEFTLMRIKSEKRVFSNLEISYICKNKNYNLKNILDLNFEKIRNIEYLDFINILVNMGFEKIICGQDFRFGKNREGNVKHLQKYFNVIIVDIQKIENFKISSSEIIKNLENDNLKYFEKTHGFKYFIASKVINGDKIGRTINFPTINLNIDKKIVPSFGSYSSNTYYEGKTFYSATYIGFRPSINSSSLRFETNIFDFEKQIYNELVIVELVKKDRNEMKFNSLDELKLQISKDVENAKKR